MNSKFLYVYPLRNKDAKAIIGAFKQFFEDVVDEVKIIECDYGSEFISNEFKKFIEDKGIQLILFNKLTSPNACAIIERANLTLRNKIDKYLQVYDTYKFVDVLQNLVDNINNTKSYSTGYKPCDVDQKIEQEIFQDKTMKKIQILN